MSQSHTERKASGRRATVVWLTPEAIEALEFIMAARGYTVRRDAMAWAFAQARKLAAGLAERGL